MHAYKLSHLFLFLLLSFSLFANDPDPQPSEIELDSSFAQQLELMSKYYSFLDSIEQTLTFERGTVSLMNGKLSLNVPEGYKFLNGDDSEMILTDLWGNPPSEKEDKSIGMLIPDTMQAVNPAYSINITYAEDGHVKDKEAKNIDYDEMLEGMLEASILEDQYRSENGYPRLSLKGWAKPPFYDQVNKKLHWAKEFNTGEEPNTLNYDIRILGRKGHVSLNAISTMDYLDEVDAHIDDVIYSVNFTEGNRYADFNPKMDKVAAYGIGGLIAGKALA